MSTMTIHTTIDLNATADAAWAQFGEGFGDWADWAPGIDESTLEGVLAEGVVRVNQTPALGRVQQTLVRFDRPHRALAYEARENLPPLFSHIRNEWTIDVASPDASRLVGEATFELTEQAEPMKDKLQGKMGMALEVFARAFAAKLTS